MDDEVNRMMGQQQEGTAERLDQISMFLWPTWVPGQEDYDTPRMPLVSKELSVGRIKEEHMAGNISHTRAALYMLDRGHVGLARYIMKFMHSEFKMTMSIDGEFMDGITHQELRYTQHQHLHQDQQQQIPQKKGFFRRK